MIEKKAQKDNKELLFEVKTLTHLAYSDKPLPQGGEIKLLSIPEIENLFNFTYSESLYGSREQVATSLQSKYKPSYFPRDISIDMVKHRLNNPLDCFVICNLGSTGHGLFSKTDIAPNTILFTYAGELRKANADDGEYDCRWIEAIDLSVQAVSAKNIGGLARFMQHLPIDRDKVKQKLKAGLSAQFPPELLKQRGINLDDFVNEMMASQCTDTELQEISFRKPAIKEKLQNCNIRLSDVVVDGIPLVIVWTEYGIKANEQIGFPYGKAYWEAAKKQPRYYTQEGTLVPLYDYHTSNSKTFSNNSNPMKLYQEGIALQRQGDYGQALVAFSQALAKFRDKFNDLLKCGNCYAALVSCYRDLKDYPNAIKACKKAMKIFLSLKEDDKLNKVRIKLGECLELSKPNLGQVYDTAISELNEKKYLQAMDQLHYLISSATKSDFKAYCHSALATCYREVKDYDLAILHCETALGIRQNIQGEEKSILFLKDKLSKLVLLKEQNQLSATILN